VDKYKKYKFGMKDIEIIICILIRENQKELLEILLKVLYKNYKYDRDYKFDEYFKYNRKFILELLLLYKTKHVFQKMNLNYY